MPNALPDRVPAAFAEASKRGIMPTWMGTKQLRQLEEALRRSSVFSARTTSAKYVSTIKELIDGMLSGTMDLPLARLTLKRTLQALGYTPEGGFPGDDIGDNDGQVPPATEATLQDLSSDRRLNLILRTQEQLMQGAGQKAKGLEPFAIRQYPAWELVRISEREVPRDWPARWIIAMENLDRGDELERDEHGKVIFPLDEDGEPRLIAMKGDPIWAAIGSSELFGDSLDVDHPPFAFNSGKGWAGVPQDEVRALGIKGPEGEPLDDVLKVLPRPQASALGIDPAVLAKLKADLKLKDEGDMLKGGDE